MKLVGVSNQRGYSLVMMITITGIAFALMIGAMIAQNNFSMNSFKTKQREETDFQNFVGEISIVLGNKKSCSAQPNFVGRTLPRTGAPVPPIAINRIAYAGEIMTANNLADLRNPRAPTRFGRITLTSLNLVWIRPVPGTTDRHLAELAIQGSGPATFGSRSFHFVIPVYVQLSPSGAIVACKSTVYTDPTTLLHDQMCPKGIKRTYDFVDELCI